jgi:anti-anti-sigma factor
VLVSPVAVRGSFTFCWVKARFAVILRELDDLSLELDGLSPYHHRTRPGGVLVTPLFTVETVDYDDEVRVVLRGDVDLAVVSELRRVLENALEVAPRRVTVDLDGVTHLDSSGIKVFVRANIRARVTGKHFSLRGAHGAVRRVLDITGVDRVVTLDDEAEAGEAGAPTT